MAENCINGYHGTTLENAILIKESQEFKFSNKDTEWLGAGAYFFAYKAHAEWWITHNRFADTETEILCATLEYDNDQLLDLDDPDQLAMLEMLTKAAVREVNTYFQDTTKAKIQTPEWIWCFTCNLIRKLSPEIGIIMYTFPDRKGLYPYSRFRGSQKQLCVSDHSIIRNIRSCAGESYVKC